MRKFIYTVQDANGVHARPAGLLVKAAKALDSTITLENAAGKSAVATKLMAVMGLGIKKGDTVTVTVEGGDEEASAAAMEKFIFLQKRAAIFRGCTGIDRNMIFRKELTECIALGGPCKNNGFIHSYIPLVLPSCRLHS